MTESRDFLAEFIRTNHRPLPGNPNGVMIQTTIQFGRSISEDRAGAAMEEAGLTGLQGGSWSFKPSITFEKPIKKMIMYGNRAERACQRNRPI
jgi:hypothetical protein